MRGGVRKGAGRKAMADCDKKKARTIYLNDQAYEEIMELPLAGADSFNERCYALLSKGMEVLREEQLSLFDASCGTGLAAMRQSKSFPISSGAGNMLQLDNDQALVTHGFRFIDLFAGIGGIRQGFARAGDTCVFSSEWDPFAAKTYEANYGEKPHGDITKIEARDIPDHEVLLAGFPCQPFSNIGKREGFSHPTQGTLFFDVLRILKEKCPLMFLLENVKGLLTNDGGRTIRIILESLKEADYNVFYHVLDAQDFGLPQRRERVIIVGFRGDLGITEFSFPKGDRSQRVPISSVLEKGATGYSVSKYLQQSYLFKKDDGCPQVVDFDSTIQVNTLCASYHKIQRLTGTFVKDGETGIRLFSELELKRIMGFPDDFQVPVSRTQMYRQFGNSVAVPVIHAVADAMREALASAGQELQTAAS